MTPVLGHIPEIPERTFAPHKAELTPHHNDPLTSTPLIASSPPHTTTLLKDLLQLRIPKLVGGPVQVSEDGSMLLVVEKFLLKWKGPLGRDTLCLTPILLTK